MITALYYLFGKKPDLKFFFYLYALDLALPSFAIGYMIGMILQKMAAI